MNSLWTKHYKKELSVRAVVNWSHILVEPVSASVIVLDKQSLALNHSPGRQHHFHVLSNAGRLMGDFKGSESLDVWEYLLCGELFVD